MVGSNNSNPVLTEFSAYSIEQQFNTVICEQGAKHGGGEQAAQATRRSASAYARSDGRTKRRG